MKSNRAATTDQQLHRALGPRIATAVVVGSVIGSGIFLKPGTIAATSGNFALILTVWITGGVLCMLGGLCVAELAAMLPQAGGLYVYLREAYGTPVAFLSGWNSVIFLYPASIGALAVAFIGAFTKALGWQAPILVETGMAVAVIAVMAWVNILGVTWGGRLQMAFTVIKVGFLLLVAALPFLLIPFVDQAVRWDHYASTVVPREPTLARQFAAVLLAVMWAYNGWEAVTPLAEEIRHPQRNLPIALIAGIGILMALYVAANIAYHGVLSMAELAQAGDHGAEEMLQSLLGRRGLAAMSAVIMCSTLGAINTTLLQAPRITFAMARDETFFRLLGRVHANYRTPAPSIAVMAIMSVLLIGAVAVGKFWVGGSMPTIGIAVVDPTPSFWSKIMESLRNGSTFDLLTNFVIFGASVFYALSVFAVIVLRFRKPSWSRPYRAWGYPLTPLIFVSVYSWFLLQVYQTNPLEAWTGLLMIGLGLPVYFGYRACRGWGSG